jgi:hypothetical protein
VFFAQAERKAAWTLELHLWLESKLAFVRSSVEQITG